LVTCGNRRQSLIILAIFTLLLIAIFYKVCTALLLSSTS
jgi:hypothetical protein